MDNRNELDKLRNSNRFQYSLVSFVPDIISDYFENKISRDGFVQLFISKLCKTNFYLSQMEPELRKKNQTTFKNEFDFAYNVSVLAAKASEHDEQSFNESLNQLIKEYNKIYQEGN